MFNSITGLAASTAPISKSEAFANYFQLSNYSWLIILMG